MGRVGDLRIAHPFSNPLGGRRSIEVERPVRWNYLWQLDKTYKVETGFPGTHVIPPSYKISQLILVANY
jgi:hypothetical protein